MNEPTQIRAGDTVSWTETLSDYPPSDGWRLIYNLVNSSHCYNIAGSTSGDGFALSVVANNTEAWAAGVYQLIGFVERNILPLPNMERHTVYTGRIEILPNLTETGGTVHTAPYDTRSHARKMLEKLEVAIEAYSTRPVEQFSDGTHTFIRPKLSDLVNLRNQYAWKVREEERKARIASGLAPGGGIKFGFRSSQ